VPAFLGFLGFVFFGRTGLFGGVLIGISMAATMRRQFAREATARRAGGSRYLALAAEYQTSHDTYDLAAFCYLKWLARCATFEPPADMSLFLWRYRLASHVNELLRRSLLDLLFYRVLIGLTSAVEARSDSMANLLVATADDSPAQVSTAKSCRTWCLTSVPPDASMYRIGLFLASVAPASSAAFLGGPVESRSPFPGKMVVWHWSFGEWPYEEKDFPLTDVPLAAGEDVRAVFAQPARYVIVTSRRLVVQKHGSALEETPLSNVLKAVERIGSHPSYAGQLHLCTSDRYYTVGGGVASCVKEYGWLPTGVVVTRYTAPPDKICQRKSLLGLSVTVACAVLLFVFRQSMDPKWFIIVQLGLCTPLLLTIFSLRDGRRGTDRSFRQAAGIGALTSG
jgi:hypothetical protein